MLKAATVDYYREKSDFVISYIHSNLDKDLNTKTLAEKSNISFFHFHRILKAFLKEPLGSYINRIRLEKALFFIRNSNMPIHEIAENIGYNDISAFSKAFVKAFGITPNKYRKDFSIELNTNIDYLCNENQVIESVIKPKIINLSDKMVCSILVTGEYGGKETYKAWEVLVEYAKKNKLTGWRPEFFSVYYDDPDITEARKCRADLCIAIKKNVKTEGEIKLNTIRGGKYCVLRYKGAYEHLRQLYYRVYTEYIIKNGILLRDLPTFEKYLNYSENTKDEDLITEIYLPVE